MFEPKIRIQKSLHEKLAVAAQKKGYASTDEFAVHVLEQAVAETEEELAEDEVRKRLQGLDYIG